MDRVHLEQMLDDLRREHAEAEEQLAMLQRRTEALRKAADGVEEVLASERAQQPDPVYPEESAETAAPASAPLADVTPRPQGRRVEDPKGGHAAQIILKEDPTRFWTVREVWEEQVKRGWAEPTNEARAAVRAALIRLAKRQARIARKDGPTHHYRWQAELPAEMVDVSEAEHIEVGHVVTASQDHTGKSPKGKTAARMILESDTSRFWSVRDVWDEQVRRGWAEPRPRGAKGNPPSRVALMRLQEDFPDNVAMIKEPLMAFKWSPSAAPTRTLVETGQAIGEGVARHHYDNGRVVITQSAQG